MPFITPRDPNLLEPDHPTPWQRLRRQATRATHAMWAASRAGWLGTAAAALALVACGGGTPVDPVPPPTPLTAQEAATMLTTQAPAYPAALAVQVIGERIEVQVRGVQRAGGTALRGDEAFPIGSMTKAVTATLAGVLVQEGRIAWTTRVVDALPALAAGARAEYGTVTLADLLAHRGGIFPATTPAELAQLPELDGTPVAQRQQLARWLLERAPSAPPRARPLYSNGGYVLAAAMLEAATGQAYEQLLAERLLTPLGLAARFGAAGSGVGEPWGHAWTAPGRWQAVDPVSDAAAFPAFGNPAGGLRLTGHELGRFLLMHLRALRGQPDGPLQPDTARTLHRVAADGFAMGWMQGEDLRRAPLSWHNGADDASYEGLMALLRNGDRAAAVVVTGWAERAAGDTSAAVARLLL